MKFKRILSLLLCAALLVAPIATLSVVTAFAEEAASATYLTPDEAGMVKNNFDAQNSDNYSASIAGWIGFDQEVSAMGWSVDDGAITWNGSLNRSPEDAVKQLAGQLAVRYTVNASLAGMPFGKHAVSFFVKLADNSVVLLTTTEVETNDPSVVEDSTYNYDSTTTADLSFIFTFGAGLGGGSVLDAAPYKLTGINQLMATAEGTYALTIKNLKTPNGHGAVVVRGNPSPNFGDANYYGHDGNNDQANPDSLSVGCAGIYFGIVTENGAPVLRINVKGNEDGSKAIPHIYKVAMSSYDITVVDDNKAITFYEGNKVLATVELSGNEAGYATKAVVTANGATETLDKIAISATAVSDFGFTARAVEVTFDAVKLTSLAAFNESLKPAAGSTVSIPVFNALASAGNTDKYVVSGTITEITSTQWGNMNIQDAEGNNLYIYGLYCNDGEIRYDAMNPQPKVGDTITVIGACATYKEAPQMASGWILQLNGADYKYEEPETILVPDCDVTLDFVEANRTEGTADKNVYVANGITVTNNKGASKTNCRQDPDHARIYQNSELIIAYPNMSAIVFTCTGGKNITDALVASAGTWTISGEIAILTFAEPVDSVTFANVNAQIRLSSLGIVAAEVETEPAAPEMWDVKKDIVMHQSFDELRINGTNNGVFAPGQSAGWDFIANLSESDKLLQYWGWVATSSATIGTFGYSINGGKITFDPAWTVTPEFTVDQVFPTAANATRMLINIDVADLVGTNDVTVYYMDDEGKITILNTFKVVKPEAPQIPSLSFGENNVIATGMGTAYTFTAKAAGTYVFNWGTVAGVAIIETENGSEEVAFPYTVELGERESITIVLATADWSEEALVDVIITGEEPVVENTLIIGENNVIATGMGTAYTFTAKAAGTYVFNWGTVAGVAIIETENGSEEIALPYSIKLGERESVTIVLATADWSEEALVDVIITGEEPVVENVLVLGDNNVAANGAGIAYTFSAKAAGTYVFNWGAIAGVALIETANGTEEIAFPYEATLTGRETITIILSTADWTDSKVDVSIAPKAAEIASLQLGANNVAANGAGIAYTFTAASAGTYVFNWGVVAGVALTADTDVNEITFPYEAILAEGETITIVLATADWTDGNVDVTITEKTLEETEPVGGDLFGGCFGVVGSGSLIALLALVPAAYALRRKNDEE